MADLADLRLSRPIPPKLNATEKKIQTIIKDVESIKFYRAKHKRNPRKVLQICEKLVYYVVQCIEKSRSDHLLQTTSIWALTTIFRMYPAEVKEIMLVIGMPRILYDILSANILQGSTRQYASELCFFLSTDSPDYMYKTVAGERKTVFDGVVGPLPSLPEIARSQKFDNIKKVLRTDKFVHHVDALDDEEQSSTGSVSLTGLGVAPERAVVNKGSTIVEGKSENAEEDSDSDEDESIFSDVSTNVFDKFTNNSFIPYRLDDHNMAKIDALFHGKKETDLIKLPSLNFLSNFGFETAADEQDVIDAEKASAEEGAFDDNGSVASSMSSDSKSRTFSIMSNYDLGTASYSGIHEFSKTSPAMLGKQYNDHSDNLLKRVTPAAPLQTNFAIQTASASAYAANNGQQGERFIATAPSMQPNTHYREVHRAATAQGFSTGKLFQIGSSSPRISSTQQADQKLLSFDAPEKEGVENIISLKSTSVGFNVPPPSSPSVIYSELARLQEKLRVEDAKAKMESESITDFLDALDPLALNNTNRNVSFQSPAVVSNSIPEGEEDLDEDDSKMHEVDEDNETKTMVDSNGVELDMSNPFIARKLERIRAEKLVDHSFMRKLLSKKISIIETQNLLERIESILKLMDKDDSGFVTWESFARIILAVAPPKLLREDVIEFMQAQTDSDQNLVDYREFIISGKVMIVDRSRVESGDQPKLYVKGWLERQKQFSGETSTLTWKTHVKWYQQRKANAIVWLMRRAARAIHQTIRLEEADKYLRVLGKRAKVLTELLEIGAKVVVTGAKRVDAKRNMLMRCLRARKQMNVMDESYRYLKTVAAAAWKQLDMIARLKAEEAERRRLDDSIGVDGKRPVTVGGKAKQADIGRVYKVDKLRNMSLTFLLARAKSALVHLGNQHAAFEDCKTIAEKSKAHTERQIKTFLSLKSTAVKANNWCALKYRVLVSLINLGQNYHKYLERRDEATTFLITMGKNVVLAGRRQLIAAEELRRIGQGKLKWLSGQADAVAYLTRRNILANKLIVRQREAIAFLRLQSRGIFENAINLQKAQHWLQDIGKRSLQHMKNKQAAIVKLQFIAKRATFLVRRSTIAVTDLTQIGQQARFKRFEFQCRSEPHRMQQMKQEKQALLLSDKEHHRQRITLPIAERWRAELFEAFEYIANSLTPPVIYDRQEIREGKLGNQKLLIGRIGFRKIILFGKLFGAKEEIEALDEYFKTMDPLCQCLIPFESLWIWFLRHAEIRDKYLHVHKRKSFAFTLNDILPLEERAFLGLFKRYGNDVDPQLGSIPSRFVSSSSPTRSPTAATNERDSSGPVGKKNKNKRIRQKGAFDGSDDGDNGGGGGGRRAGGHDSDSDSDNESFGDADVEVDHYGDQDIGKLMRYLTRRDLARKEKEEKEKAEREQKEKEEQEKAAFVADLLKGAATSGEELAAGEEVVSETADVAAVASTAAADDNNAELKPPKEKSID